MKWHVKKRPPQTFLLAGIFSSSKFLRSFKSWVLADFPRQELAKVFNHRLCAPAEVNHFALLTCSKHEWVIKTMRAATVKQTHQGGRKRQSSWVRKVGWFSPQPPNSSAASWCIIISVYFFPTTDAARVRELLCARTYRSALHAPPHSRERERARV